MLGIQGVRTGESAQRWAKVCAEREARFILEYGAYELAKRKAHSKVAQAIKRGVLTSPRQHCCIDCGGPAREYDHRDYTRPLDVQPVCHSCNLLRGPAEHPARDYGSFRGVA